MELRHLRYFLAVAREKHFGRAANQLHIGQPTLSEQIRVLEREVGGPLFVRTSRGVTLTEAGELLLPEAQRAVDLAARAFRVVQQSIRGDLGSVRVGFSGVAVLGGFLSADLRAFHDAHPLVEIEVTELAPHLLTEAVRAGTIDVGYGPRFTPTDASVLVFSRAHVPLLVAVHDAHPLATAASVGVNDLSGENLLVFTEDDEAVPTNVAAAMKPDRVRNVASTLGVLALTAAGLGVTIVPAPTQGIAVPGLVYRNLLGTNDLTLVVTSRTGETAGPVRALLDTALQAARTAAG